MANFEIGGIYKNHFKSVNGGWGLVPWYSLNYLKPEEFPIWLKICEFSYKNTNGDGIVHLTKKWLYDYFESEGGKEYVEGVLRTLSTIGYISIDESKDYINIEINYHIVMLAMKLVDKNRRFAQKLREYKTGLCEHDMKRYDGSIINISPEDLLEVECLITKGKEA